MTPNHEDLRVIARWLNRLASVTRHPAEEPLDPDTLRDYSELLGRDLPSAAFTTDSLHYTATGSEWFPAYDKIRREVGEWWSRNRPRTAPALAHDSALTGEEEGFLRHWRKRTAEISAYTDRRKADLDYARLSSYMRARCPAKLWRQISGEKPEQFIPPTPEQSVIVRGILAGLGIKAPSTYTAGGRAA